jgi:hypothetical protein
MFEAFVIFLTTSNVRSIRVELKYTPVAMAVGSSEPTEDERSRKEPVCMLKNHSCGYILACDAIGSELYFKLKSESIYIYPYG